MGFGGVDRIEDVEPFIRNVLKGRIIPDETIERAKDRYKQIGGGSPLLSITQAQAQALEDALNRKEGLYNYKTYVGMRYWAPFIKDTLKQVKADGIDDSLAAIMSPFQTMMTTGGYHDDVETALKDISGLNVEFILPWHLNPRFISCIAEKIEAGLARFKNRKDALVIFSNHSLPLGVLEGDPYELHIQMTVEYILKKMAPIDYKVGYQSQGEGPREWKGPKTEDIIIEAKKRRKEGVVIVPLGFASDHVETLYDIDMYFKKTAESLGLVFYRTPSLNTNPVFIEMLADLIIRQAEKRQ